MCDYCTIECRPLVWRLHDMYAYVNTIHVDVPRIDIDLFEEDGRHIRAHIPVNACPMCGRKLRGDV